MSRELCVEPINDVVHRLDKPSKLRPHVLPAAHFDILHRYIEGSLRLDVDLICSKPSGTHDFESGEFLLTAEKVVREPLHSDDFTPWGKRNWSNRQFLRRSGYDSQPSMSVEASEVVNILQSDFEAHIRVASRFVSRVRLYRFQPINELLREWELVQSALLEVPIFSVESRELQSVCCTGGRLGTLDVGDRIPHQSIESRAELVSKLTEFEREGVAVGPLLSFGSEGGVDDPPPGTFLLTEFGSRGFDAHNGVPFVCKGSGVGCRSLRPIPAVFEPRSHAGEYYQKCSAKYIIAFLFLI